MVSASAESVPVQTTIPSAEDCVADDGEDLYRKWHKIIVKYEGIVIENTDYTLDEFKADMNSVLTSPELINCGYNLDNRVTPAYLSAIFGSVEGAKWVISKGADLTVRLNSATPYEWALYRLKQMDTWPEESPSPRPKAQWRQGFIEVAKIFAPPPALATKPCAEVDGQTPPANEYCIVAENVQSSRKRKLGVFEKLFTGLDDLHVVYSGLSGTGLYPGWTATFTFTCSALSQGCGDSNYNFEHLDKNHSQSLRDRIREAYGFGVFCGDSGNLLDVKEVEAGESVSFTHSSDTERSSPWYQACSANSAGPFTLSIKTTRLAQ